MRRIVEDKIFKDGRLRTGLKFLLKFIKFVKELLVFFAMFGCFFEIITL